MLYKMAPKSPKGDLGGCNIWSEVDIVKFVWNKTPPISGKGHWGSENKDFAMTYKRLSLRSHFLIQRNTYPAAGAG